MTASPLLNQRELARRWSVSPRTLERWRWLRQGPPYIKTGRRVLYRPEDIEAFEVAQLRENTMSPNAPGPGAGLISARSNR